MMTSSRSVYEGFVDLSWGFATRRSRSYGGSWFSWGWSRNNSACFGDLGRGYSFTPIRSSG